MDGKKDKKAILHSMDCTDVLNTQICPLTGKNYTENKWSYGPGGPGSTGFNAKESLQVNKLFTSNDCEAIKSAIGRVLEQMPLGKPSLPYCGSARADLIDFLYPIQCAINLTCSPECVQAMLELGSPGIMSGYNVYKHIIKKIVFTSELDTKSITRFTRYIELLLKHHVDPNALSYGNSVPLSDCPLNASALVYTDKYLTYLQQGSPAHDRDKKIALLNTIQQLFQQYKAVHTETHPFKIKLYQHHRLIGFISLIAVVSTGCWVAYKKYYTEDKDETDDEEEIDETNQGQNEVT